MKANTREYKQLHLWVRKNKPKPNFCKDCDVLPPYEVANISGEYKKDISDYDWLCRRCHSIRDKSGKDNPSWKGGIKSLNPKEYQRKKQYKKFCIDCNKSITRYAIRCKPCSNKFRSGV